MSMACVPVDEAAPRLGWQDELEMFDSLLREREQERSRRLALLQEMVRDMQPKAESSRIRKEKRRIRREERRKFREDLKRWRRMARDLKMWAKEIQRCVREHTTAHMDRA
ncbi:uncharacterized protein LOC129584145 [Paramacrobiotus metropolitanus]|uniref:uncharacterized protein LOC129584145 n=1 Tax=Paramacrobiotus metropolitanus TaxID=2943436 RepID=UPI002445F4B9|nr:uncharacterized protein LOC129584145 [Paramacrobiotus metropolitanus]